MAMEPLVLVCEGCRVRIRTADPSKARRRECPRCATPLAPAVDRALLGSPTDSPPPSPGDRRSGWPPGTVAVLVTLGSVASLAFRETSTGASTGFSTGPVARLVAPTEPTRPGVSEPHRPRPMTEAVEAGPETPARRLECPPVEDEPRRRPRPTPPSAGPAVAAGARAAAPPVAAAPPPRPSPGGSWSATGRARPSSPASTGRSRTGWPCSCPTARSAGPTAWSSPIARSSRPRWTSSARRSWPTPSSPPSGSIQTAHYLVLYQGTRALRPGQRRPPGAAPRRPDRRPQEARPAGRPDGVPAGRGDLRHRGRLPGQPPGRPRRPGVLRDPLEPDLLLREVEARPGVARGLGPPQAADRGARGDPPDPPQRRASSPGSPTGRSGWSRGSPSTARPPRSPRRGSTGPGLGQVNPIHMATIRDLDDPMPDPVPGAREAVAIGRDRGTPLVEYLVTRKDLTPTDYALSWALTHYLATRADRRLRRLHQADEPAQALRGADARAAARRLPRDLRRRPGPDGRQGRPGTSRSSRCPTPCRTSR